MTEDTRLAAPFPGDLIRPWYPAGEDVQGCTVNQRLTIKGHLYRDCEELLRWVVDPQEGSGWLDLRAGGVCEPCLYRHDPQLYAELVGEDEQEAAPTARRPTRTRR